MFRCPKCFEEFKEFGGLEKHLWDSIPCRVYSWVVMAMRGLSFLDFKENKYEPH